MRGFSKRSTMSKNGLDVEKLFREICADNVDYVRSVASFRLLQLIHEPLFAMFVQKVQDKDQDKLVKKGRSRKKEEKKPLFIAYGAHTRSSMCKRAIETRLKGGKIVGLPGAATALHVAAWKNAVKVARYLLHEGGNTGGLDENGVCAFERAGSDKMRQVLRRPVAPLHLDVLSCSLGCARIRYSVVNVAPEVCKHEVTDVEHGSVWTYDIPSENVTVYSHEGRREASLRTVVFETPKGSIRSNERYRFSARVCNVEGIWSEASETSALVESKHWAEEWSEDTERKSSPREDDSEVELKLGAVSFGRVPARQFIKRVVEMQGIAASKIQAAHRRASAKRRVREMRRTWKKQKRRRKAAVKIQRGVRRYLLAGTLNRGNRRPGRKKSGRRGRKREFGETSKVLEKERARLEFLRLHGVELHL